MREDREVIELLNSNDPLEKARQRLSGGIARFEQESAQQNFTPIEMRRREFELVETIIETYEYWKEPLR